MKNKVVTALDQTTSQITTSTLNPVAFIAYNGGRQLVNVDLLRTWMCPGHTGNKRDHCKNPYGKIPKEFL